MPKKTTTDTTHIVVFFAFKADKTKIFNYS